MDDNKNAPKHLWVTNDGGRMIKDPLGRSVYYALDKEEDAAGSCATVAEVWEYKLVRVGKPKIEWEEF